jgi:hypothetical protein
MKKFRIKQHLKSKFDLNRISMNNETSNITDTQLDSGVYSDKNTLLPIALVLTFPVVVVVCLYACIFRIDRNRERTPNI